MFLAVLFCSNTMFGNDASENTKRRLLKNGVVLMNTEKNYTDHQYYLLQSFDFTPYRNYTTNRTIQIEDGPIIQLLSLTEMQRQGNDIPSEIIQNKKDEVIDSRLKPIITLVNIGFRYGPILNTETGF